jgi:hypothetical protein
MIKVMQKSKLLAQFEAARDNLGIVIAAPYEVDIDDNVKVRAEILVKHFGGKNGTLVVANYAVVKPYLEQLRILRYGFSVLEEPSEAYNREIFIEMLSDWGWTGDGAMKPAWFRKI